MYKHRSCLPFDQFLFFLSGCARTEGYYKLSMREKAKYLQHAYNIQLAAEKAKQLVSIDMGPDKLKFCTKCVNIFLSNSFDIYFGFSKEPSH